MNDFQEFAQAFFEMTYLPNRKSRRFAQSGNTISSGMAAGTVCEADADGSDSPGADGAPAASGDDDGGDPDPEPARSSPSGTPSPAIAPLPHGPKTRRNAAAKAGEPIPPTEDRLIFWRLPEVLKHIPVSRSTWLHGVKSGRYPQPIRLSKKCVVWRAADVREFLESL